MYSHIVIEKQKYIDFSTIIYNTTSTKLQNNWEKTTTIVKYS